NWARAEDAFCHSPRSQHALNRLQHNVERGNGFGAVLRRDFSRINDGFAEAARWYADLASRYGICTERRLCDFALWLACQPQRLPEIYAEDLDTLLNHIRDCPAISRGARMLALLSTNDGETGS